MVFDFQNEFVKKMKPYLPVNHKTWFLSNDEVYKLDWNESTIPPSPKVVDYVLKFIKSGKLHWYPPIDNFLLREKIANYSGVKPSNIQYFNGSDASHEIIIKTFLNPGEKVCVVYPTYDNFRMIIDSYGGKVLPFNLNKERGFSFKMEDFEKFIDKEEVKIVYICNPNNPTGTLYSYDVIKYLVLNFPNTLFVIDEAYYEFSGVTAKDLVFERNNIVITRTFSKAFALASFRIGYIIANEDVISVLNKVRNPKSVSYISQVAAMGALDDISYMKNYVLEVRRAKKYFEKELKNLEIGNVYSGGGNYVLVELDKSKIYKDDLIKFLDRKKVFIRNLEHIPSFENFVRFTIGTYKQMQKVVEILREYIEGIKR